METVTPVPFAIPVTVPARPVLARQRGQRVILRIGGTLHGNSPDGALFVIPVRTLLVTPRGAQIVSPIDVPLESLLVFEHNVTHDRQSCRVAESSQTADGRFRLRIEFEGHSPDFWQIAFPPQG
jgi:hypothetical protein